MSPVKGSREQRVGVQKEAVASTLANTAAKLAENPPVSRLSCEEIIFCFLKFQCQQCRQ